MKVFEKVWLVEMLLLKVQRVDYVVVNNWSTDRWPDPDAIMIAAYRRQAD